MKIAVIGSFLIALLHSILFYGEKLGISVFLFCIALGFFILYILNKNNKIENKKALLLSIPIILISATYFIFNNTVLYITNIIVLFILFVLMIVLAIFKENTIGLVISKAAYLVLGPVEFIEEAVASIGETIIGIFKRKQPKEKNEKNEKIGKIVIGILITIPILALILILLSSADSIFSSELKNIFSKIFTLDIFNVRANIDLFFRIIIIALISIYLIALIYNITEDDFCQSDIKEKRKWKVDEIIGNTILTILNIVYIVFCYIQISVLFMKTGNMNSFDYASYARQGFFQLMAVSVINLIIILITSKRNEKTKKLSYTKIMNLLLAVFTLIILFSSYYRMHLYESEYGYTFLRLIVYFSLITEAILIIPTVLYILDFNVNLTKTYFIVIIIMYLVVNYINIDKMIAKKNIDRYLNNEQEIDELDINYLTTLSPDAVDEIRKLENVNDNEIKYEVNSYLIDMKEQLENINYKNFNINRFIVKNELKDMNIDDLKRENQRLWEEK